MNRIVIFHGSERIIKEPRYGVKSKNSDYGDAFYCTQDIYAAKEWANKRIVGGYANKYLFDGRDLKVLDLTKKDVIYWIAILMHFRDLDPIFKDTYKKELTYLEKHYYINVDEYDVIIGYRADDSFFAFPLMFVESRIRLSKLDEIYHLGFLGLQIAIKSEKAFKRLKYIESIKAEPIYKEKYAYRIDDADRRFKEIVKEERWEEGERLIDLVKKDD